MPDYVIKAGDTFFNIAQTIGCCCEELILLNPTVNPDALQVGQKIVLPPYSVVPAQNLTKTGYDYNCESLDEALDDVQVEIEGIKFRVRRLGEHRVPHEVHLIIPRTEIHKIEHSPCGSSELKLMISNINIVNSPRLMSEGQTNLQNEFQSSRPSNLERELQSDIRNDQSQESGIFSSVRAQINRRLLGRGKTQ